MHSKLRERSRPEGGFTLIELLVVMIIIAILMAVAVPTFLAQKNNAQKTKATANIKQIVNAIESCAVNNTDGTYTGCLDPTALKTFEKGLTSLTIGTASPALNQYSIRPNGTQGYSVAAQIQDGGVNVFFAENHGSDGSLGKVCSGTLPAITDVTGSPVAASRTCTTGKWG